MPGDKIDILVHKEQVIHGFVEFSDGSVLAQLGAPDMVTPVAVALAWPRRFPLSKPSLDLASIGCLHFERPDEGRFPALRLARQALDTGGAAMCAMNAANEAAVGAFLSGRIGFQGIVRIISSVLERLGHDSAVTLEQLTDLDARARRQAEILIARPGAFSM